MALVALDGTPLVAVGQAGTEGLASLPSAGSTTIDAANEACILIGQIFTEDGGSHTINTTGSSSLQWMTGAVTFANAGTTVKVGLASMDTATGPPGRATNVANVITFDVSKSLTGGGGGITATSWQTHVPDAGTKTIANGDLVAMCVQMTARGGVDSVVMRNVDVATNNTVMPQVTQYTGAAYANSGQKPNAVITFSDGTLGFFFGGSVFTNPQSNQTWNNTSGTKEYGNYFLMPVPAKIYGFLLECNMGGDTDVILYSDPLGTPAAQKTVSFDLNTIGIAAVGAYTVALFASPYSSTARQPLAGIIKPTSATNITARYLTFNASAHQKSLTLGTNAYAVNRNAGAFAAQNSNKDRFSIGLLVGAFEHGVWPMSAIGI